MKVDGECLCGQLKWVAEVDESAVCICHCDDCQVLSGSAFRVTVPVTGEAFAFVAGMPATHVKTAASGRKRELAFCPVCGTSVYSRPQVAGDDYFGLRVGALRQKRMLIPTGQYWCGSAQGWVGNLAYIDDLGDERAPSADSVITPTETQPRPACSATLIVDDARVRVTRFDFAPGAETGWHRHGHDYVITTITDCVMLLEEPGGGSRRATIPAGTAYRRHEGVEHNVVNAGDAPMSFVEVELK